MIKITTYNILQKLRHNKEINSLQEILDEFYSLPDASGCYMILEKNKSKIKSQLAHNEYIRFTFYLNSENKSILEKEKYCKQLMQFFAEEKTQEEYEKLYNNPLKYFNQESDKKIKEVRSESINNRKKYRTYKGKKYTEEEWVIKEKELWLQYARKNKLSIEEKSGKFFLDEKNSNF